jgi:5-methylcytosine-specific restriction endonuclease McrA
MLVSGALSAVRQQWTLSQSFVHTVGGVPSARYPCELCGVFAEVRALQVDHIVPRSRGGTDDPDNLQALCYRCNSMKRDRDTTDFRGVRES